MDTEFVLPKNHITVINTVTKNTGKGYQGFIYVTLHFYLMFS